MDKDVEYYVNLNWTLVFGKDTGFSGQPYHYIEIKEFPNFVYCAPTKEIALLNYKNQLRLVLQIMLEDEEKIPNPGEYEENTTT